jgi:hypothetical protein
MTKFSKIRTISTSDRTSSGSEIVLSESSETRRIFKPELVENLKNPKACLKGKFVHQRKSRTQKWEDCESFSCASLKAGQEINLPLNTEETRNLIEGLIDYQKIYDKHGVPFGQRDFIITDTNIGRIAEQFANLEYANEIIAALQNLEPEHLENLSTFLGVSRLRNVVEIWEENKDNEKEEFWQKLFQDNSWLLAQLMLYPVVLIKSKGYVGGKGITNEGGNLPDYLMQNRLTENILIVEIKTPSTQLLGSEYRGTYFE